jgi:hypothetical protein
MRNCKCVICFEADWRGFSHTGNEGLGANWHENMSCFGGGSIFILVDQKSHATKLEPRNVPPTKTCQVSTCYPMHVLMIGQSKPLKHIPLKHVTFSELCFNPIRPSSMFSHAIPIHAPWPIHNVLDLFQLCMVTVYFFAKLWRLHQCSPTKDLDRLLITKTIHGGVKEALSFHP